MAMKRRYSSSEDSTRDRILKAALQCISSTSVRGLSVRAIAARAEVNVATVHYYFHTKDAVITEALKLFFAPAMTLLEGILLSKERPRDRLLGFLASYMDQFHRNPGIYTSLIEAIIASNIRELPDAPSTYETVLIGMIGKAKEGLLSLVRDVSGIEDETLLSFRTLQMMTSVIHPILISTIPQTLFNIDLREESSRHRYVELLVDSLSATGRSIGGCSGSA